MRRRTCCPRTRRCPRRGGRPAPPATPPSPPRPASRPAAAARHGAARRGRQETRPKGFKRSRMLRARPPVRRETQAGDSSGTQPLTSAHVAACPGPQRANRPRPGRAWVKKSTIQRGCDPLPPCTPRRAPRRLTAPRSSRIRWRASRVTICLWAGGPCPVCVSAGRPSHGRLPEMGIAKCPSKRVTGGQRARRSQATHRRTGLGPLGRSPEAPRARPGPGPGPVP